MTTWEKGWLLLFINAAGYLSSAQNEARAFVLTAMVVNGVAFMLAGERKT